MTTHNAPSIVSAGERHSLLFSAQTPDPSPRASRSPSYMQTIKNKPRGGSKGSEDGAIKNAWEGARWGNITYLTPIIPEDSATMLDIPGVPQHKLNQLQATSIAGNDIASSCLYSCGLVMQACGRMSTVAIALVSIVLYLFRIIYSEVGSALPLNGGTYNALLNTSTKTFASVAACLTILSYTATAVVSASSAAAYIAMETTAIDQQWVAIGILALFAVLTLMGITDSANVASAIFLTHLATLTAVLVCSVVYCVRDGFDLFRINFQSTDKFASPNDNIALDIFYGFGTAMLGVTGFESSSNYIEEQQVGVFPKTLRNMWAVVGFFNPLIAVLSMGVVKLVEVQDDEFANSILAHVAQRGGGDAMRHILVADATLVLAAGVLTAYVGIVGLVRRLALDRCVPSFLLQTNKWRDTNHYIILAFFLITTSLRLMVDDMVTLGGVYGISFLSVMSLFTISNIMLKYKRARLPRTPIASYPHATVSLLLVLTGLIANVAKSAKTVEYFLLYGAVAVIFVMGMFCRVAVLRVVLALSKNTAPAWVVEWMQRTVTTIRARPLVFFAKNPNIAILNKAVTYVKDNEDTNCVRIVYVYKDREAEAGTLREFEESATILDRIYPKMTIELDLVEGDFCPEVVEVLAEEIGVPRNFMFMCCPSDKFPHHVAKFGGVRVITHH
eukprot:PhM_4_TR17540/c0_g1_i1/m.99297